MTYQETINYLYQTLPMFSKVGATAIKKDITNTIELCKVLNNPHTQFKTIHIAGTNGKGSTSHMLAAILQTAGYTTGLYTSPHLKDFRERIKVNGKMCEKEFVVDFVEKIQPYIEKIQPSFFEITVAMAFAYFAQQKVDIAIVEVGLGGRLDSTNIIVPELSVITNIGWDHMNLLGDSLDKIASEKAGIIKQNIPVVIGEYLPETKHVFENKAASVQSPIIWAQEKRWVSEWKYQHHQLVIEIAEHTTSERETYQLDLPGLYQTKNILTVLESVHQLQKKGWHISLQNIKKALTQVKCLTGLHGRWELIHQHPTVIMDVGHNVDGIKLIVEQLEVTSFNHLHIIIGMVKDKDVDSVLNLLPKYATYYYTQAHIPRALDAKILQQKAAYLELNGKVFTDVNLALHSAKSVAKKDDLILVCGSVFLVGEVIN